MRPARKPALFAGAAAAVMGTTTALSPAASAAQQTASLSGTVNCNGSATSYSSTRYLTGYSNVTLYVSQAAYSDGNVITGRHTDMGFSVKIVKTGEAKSAGVTGADRWATFSTSEYLPKTAFTMAAWMHKSSGTCHNSWAGTLHY